MRRFIQVKQPHIYREFESLLRQYPLLQANRAFHEAVCHFLDDKLPEFLDGYRPRKADALPFAILERGMMFFRHTTTLCYAIGSIDAHATALTDQAAQPKLSIGARFAFQAALHFYKRLLGFAYAAMQDAKRLGAEVPPPDPVNQENQETAASACRLRIRRKTRHATHLRLVSK